MEAIRFTFNDFNFVIHPFEFTGMNGVLTVIQDSITISIKHLGKGVHRPVVQATGQGTPIIQRFFRPASVAISPDAFECFF